MLQPLNPLNVLLQWQDQVLKNYINFVQKCTMSFSPFKSTSSKSKNEINKRAQRALGRSPEEKVKGHSGANNREPQGHNLNNFGRGPIDDVIYEIWKHWAL